MLMKSDEPSKCGWSFVACSNMVIHFYEHFDTDPSECIQWVSVNVNARPFMEWNKSLAGC